MQCMTCKLCCRATKDKREQARRTHARTHVQSTKYKQGDAQNKVPHLLFCMCIPCTLPLPGRAPSVSLVSCWLSPESPRFWTHTPSPYSILHTPYVVLSSCSSARSTFKLSGLVARATRNIHRLIYLRSVDTRASGLIVRF